MTVGKAWWWWAGHNCRQASGGAKREMRGKGQEAARTMEVAAVVSFREIKPFRAEQLSPAAYRQQRRRRRGPSVAITGSRRDARGPEELGGGGG